MFLTIKEYFNKVLCNHQMKFHSKYRYIAYVSCEEKEFINFLCEKCGYVRKVKLN